MILRHSLPTGSAYTNRFHQGSAQLVYFAGHGEYWFDDKSHRRTKVDVKVEKFDTYEAQEKGSKTPFWVKRLPDWENENSWGIFVRLTGDVYGLWCMFYSLTNQLDPEQDPADYMPGGDDDTFDYYPSGFEWATDWAKDLDEIDRTFASLSPRDGKHTFTARHRIEDIVAKLLIATGPYGDWEFEGHAAPYIKEVKK